MTSAPFRAAYKPDHLGGHGNDFQRRLALLLAIRSTLADRPFRMGIKISGFDDVGFLDETSREWWLIQTKHSMQHKTLITESMLFPDENSGSDLNSDYSLLKYFKSYLQVREHWPHGGDAFKFFLFTNRTLKASIGSVEAQVDKMLHFSDGKSAVRHVHLRPTAEELYSMERLVNRDFELLCTALSRLFTEGIAEPILTTFRIPLSKLLIKRNKRMKFSEDFNNQHSDWRVRILYETVKSNFEDLQLNVETASVVVPECMKNFWTIESLGKDGDTETLPLLVTRRMVGEFFSVFVLSTSFNAYDLCESINNEGRRWMKRWIRPEILGQIHQTSTFESFWKSIQNWEQPLKKREEIPFLTLEEGKQFLVDAERVFRLVVQSRGKHIRIGLLATEKHYIHRRVKYQVKDTSSDFELTKYIQDEEIIDQLYDEFKDLQCLVLVAEPGMGKSTLWQYLAFYAQRKYPEASVYLLNLSEITQKLPNASTVEDILDLFDSVLSEENLEIIRNSSRNIILFFDALDEMDSDNIKEVLNRIQSFENRKNIKILLSGRCCVQELLEKKIDTKIMKLLPFDECDQKSFLNMFWNDNHNSHSKKFNDYCSKLLTFLNHNNFLRTNDFVGSPLTMRMFVEVYLESYNKYLSSGAVMIEDIISQKDNVVDIYDNFVTKCILLQYKKKFTTECDDAAFEKTFCDQIKADRHKYQLLATKLMLPNKHFSEISDNFIPNLKVFLSDICERNEESLLVETIHGEPRISHRTFAEFFSAKYLCESIERTRRPRTFQQFTESLSTILSSHEGIRKFMLAIMNSNPSPKQIKALKQLGTVVAYWLCETNCFNLVRDLWDGYDPDPKLLHSAVENNALETLEFLLTKMSTVECGDLLCTAAEKGHIDIVRCLIKHGADVHSRDEGGKTPLHWAAQHGHTEIVELLLAGEAEVESVDLSTMCDLTPLHLAALNGHKNIVELLIAKDANVNAAGANESTPIHLAVLRGDAELVKLLILNGADIHAMDSDEKTPLLLAVYRKYSDIAKFLISAGADINQISDKGKSALNLAAWDGHTEQLELLMLNGANINSTDAKGSTALHYAAWKGHTDIVEMLISRNANINLADNEGYTPLHCAAWKGRTEVVQILIYYGADVNSKDVNGRTPLYFASKSGNKAVAELLISKNADVRCWDKKLNHPLHSAAMNGHKDLVKMLIAEGATVNVMNKYGQTPLDCAKEGNHKDVMEQLVSKNNN